MTKRTHNNGKSRGFTVVEMLVSVAILVMVIGPLLGGFVTSQRITTKAYYLGEASLVSRNIIETIRAEGVDSFVSTTPFGGTVDEPAPGDYEIEIAGIPSSTIASSTTTASNTVEFDARVTIKASDPRFSSFNDHEITEYLPMDAVFVQPREDSDPDRIAVEHFLERMDFHGIDAPLTGLNRMFNRTITIDVDIDPDLSGPGPYSADAHTLSITVIYEYSLPQPQYSHEDFQKFPITYFDIYRERLKFEADGVTPLPIVAYLFYLPHYAIFATEPDAIVVDNQEMVPLSVFIVKQRPALIETVTYNVGADDEVTWTEGTEWTEENKAAFSSQEGLYKARIEQMENISLRHHPQRLVYTTVYSNFRENFAGDTPSPSSLALRFEHWAVYGTAYRVQPTESDLLVSQSSRDRMFAITVDVYHAGDLAGGGDPIYSYDATHLE